MVFLPGANGVLHGYSLAPRKAVLSQMQCTGNETRLVDCQFQAFSQPDCSRDLTIYCAIEPENGTVGDLRLIDVTENSNIVSGTLQIYNGTWGSVCGSFYDWSSDNSRVACQELGYFGACKWLLFERSGVTQNTQEESSQ